MQRKKKRCRKKKNRKTFYVVVATMKSGSIVVTYFDPLNQFSSVAHLLLKILSGLELLPDVPHVGDPPRVLSDSIGLWEESTRLDDAFLCLYIGRSVDDAACLQWVQQARLRSAGFLVLVLVSPVGSSSSSDSIPHAHQSQWSGLAHAIWRKARSQPSLTDDLVPRESVDAAHVVTLHPTQGGPDRGDRPLFRKREAKLLTEAMVRELATGFRRRISLGRDLVRVYSMCSMWSAVLIVLDQQETVSIATKKRCKNCGLYVLSATDSQCTFHPGNFRSINGGGRFSVSKWTCCSLSDSRAPPCRVVDQHELEPLPLLASASISAGPSVSGLLVDVLPVSSFRPMLVSPNARVLDPSSYAEPSRQLLLAQQCQVLSKMKDGIRLARRVLRFLQMAWRSASPLLQPLELAAWSYCVCSEAVELYRQADAEGSLPRLLQVMRSSLVSIGMSVAVDESVCSPMVLAHPLLAAVFRDEEVFVRELRSVLHKEQAGWERLKMRRHEAVAVMQTAMVLFALGKFEDAYTLVRSVHLRLESWPPIFSRAVHVMSGCEERLGLSSVASTLLLAHMDVSAVKRLIQLTGPGQPLAVKPLDPHFMVQCFLDLEGQVRIQARCLWIHPVVPDAVEVELQCAGTQTKMIIRSDDVSPTRVPSMRSTWFVSKVVCNIGTLKLIRLYEEGDRVVLPIVRPAFPQQKVCLLFFFSVFFFQKKEYFTSLFSLVIIVLFAQSCCTLLFWVFL